MVHSCCVPNCITKKKQTSMHRFPAVGLDSQRYYTWLRMVNNKKLFNLPKQQVNVGFRVCSMHFSADQWENIAERKLKKTAVPNVNLDLNEVGSATTLLPSNCIMNDHNYSGLTDDSLIEGKVDNLQAAHTNLDGALLKTSNTLLLDAVDDGQSIPTFEQFSSVCRICLSTINVAKCLTIFDYKYGISLGSIVEEYCKIQFSVDLLPQYLCQNCVKILTNIHTFRSKCHINNQILKRVLNKYKNGKDDYGISDDFHKQEDEIIVAVETYNQNNFKKSGLLDEVVRRRMGVFQCNECSEVLSSEEQFIEHDRQHKRKKVKEELNERHISDWIELKEQIKNDKVSYSKHKFKHKPSNGSIESMKHFLKHCQRSRHTSTKISASHNNNRSILKRNLAKIN